MFLIVNKKYRHQIELIKRIQKLRYEQFSLEHYLGIEKVDDPIAVSQHRKNAKEIDDLKDEIVWSMPIL